MNSPRFPRSPDIHQRPFEDGTNPFSDNEATSAPASDNAGTPYQARVVDDQHKPQPGNYESILASRPRPLLILACIGAAISSVSIVLAIMAIASADWVESMFYGAPVNLLTVVFSIPAWQLARIDLRAMRAGAMESSGRRGTRVAYWLGLLGTIIGFAPAIGSIAAVIISFWE